MQRLTFRWVFFRLQIITVAQGDLRSNRLRPNGGNTAKATFGMGYGHRLVWKGDVH